LYLEIPFDERLKNIVEEYGKGDTEKLVNAIIRIKKRLGGLETKTAINHLLEGDVAACFSILLQYYDKWYKKSIDNLREHRETLVQNMPCANTDAALQSILNQH
jgi:tRNA 2-selenouridine synthase